MRDMVIDVAWIDSIDVGCVGGSCECGAMLGGGGSEPRGSRQSECSCDVGECISVIWCLMQRGSTALMHAAESVHVNVVQCLVEAGVNLDAATSNVSGHVMWSILMRDMVIDAGLMDSIDASCQGGSCECGAMLGGGGSKPRGSRLCECSCDVGECISVIWYLMERGSTALM